MPPRRPRAQSHVEVQEQREIAPSVIAEQNPPPSLLDVIMEKILDQHQQQQFDESGQQGQQQGGGGGWDDTYGAQVGGAGGFGDSPGHHQQQPRQPARHPERPILSRAVLCGDIANNSDATAIRQFLEDACNFATDRANEADPLKGKMIANADALGLPQEFMKVIGTFVELPRHFWVILEAEPPHLHLALTEIQQRLVRGAKLRQLQASNAQQQHDQQHGKPGGGGAGGLGLLGSTAASSVAAKAAQAQAQQQQQQAAAAAAASGAFDGTANVHIAFYADDVIERIQYRWSTIDLTNAPTAVAGGGGGTPPLDEYVVDSIHSLTELSNTQQSTGGGALGGVRGISGLADTARMAKLASLTLPRDDLTDKMKESGFFFTLDEFVREFCTAATAVPVMYADLIHPIEPELEY